VKTTRQIYCRYLLSSQIKSTCTNLADHVDTLDHNSIYRYLKNEKLTPPLVWEKARQTIVQTTDGYILFDDTAADKSYSHDMAGVRRQYSGNAGGIVKGMRILACVYYNARADRFWVIDYRIFDPDRDGKPKLDHVSEMLDSIERRRILFGSVLMDSWYATTDLMRRLIKADKLFYRLIKRNRLVDESGGQEPYRVIEPLKWTAAEEQMGKTVKLRGFAGATHLKLFRVVVSTSRRESIVTDDLTQSNTEAAHEASGHRWKIEQFHREAKQTTGLERCQCRLNRSQRNHIATAMPVWLCVKEPADKSRKTVYQLKQGLLSSYLKQQMRNPTIAFT